MNFKIREKILLDISSHHYSQNPSILSLKKCPLSVTTGSCLSRVEGRVSWCSGQPGWTRPLRYTISHSSQAPPSPTFWQVFTKQLFGATRNPSRLTVFYRQSKHSNGVDTTVPDIVRLLSQQFFFAITTTRQYSYIKKKLFHLTTLSHCRKSCRECCIVFGFATFVKWW